MVRAWSVLLLFAGCDSVLGLDRSGHDDDGDGTPDNEDPCPHIAGQSEVDVDGDGISADCDVNDAVATPVRLFWSFLDGQLPPEFDLVRGTAVPDLDEQAILLGQTTGFHALVIDVTTDTALIDIGFEILENAIDDGTDPPSYAEIGIYAVHRGFPENDLTMRGDVCYFGRNPPPGGKVYIELNEDEASRGQSVQLPGLLTGAAGRMRLKRAPARLDCTVARTGTQTSDGFDVQDETRTGPIAISADKVRARISYVWISRP